MEAVLARTGATIMGKRMFEDGEHNWPEEAPFHTSVSVLTREVRKPWERKGGTTFHFVNDGIESALRQARADAGNKDVRIAGGARVILQYLHTGLIDDIAIAVAPLFMGAGVRLFEGIDRKNVALRITQSVHSPAVTHLRYAVEKKP